jgi:hypothetical protein
MHRQIKIVAILLIVQGALEACMGLFLCVMGPVMMGILASAPPPSSGGSAPPPALFGGIYIVMGLATLIGGVLKIVAGARNVKYRGRVLGFVAMGSGILSMLSCYCMPTALGVGIYGLIVYLNQNSARAFELGETGMPGEQILATIDGYGGGYGGYPPQYPPPPLPPMF